MSWDVAIIGGGVVGTAIARELAGYQLRCVLLEADGDVGTGTTKATGTAVKHAEAVAHSGASQRGTKSSSRSRGNHSTARQRLERGNQQATDEERIGYGSPRT